MNETQRIEKYLRTLRMDLDTEAAKLNEKLNELQKMAEVDHLQCCEALDDAERYAENLKQFIRACRELRDPID